MKVQIARIPRQQTIATSIRKDWNLVPMWPHTRTAIDWPWKSEPHSGQKAITSVVQVADNAARNCHFSVWAQRDGSHARWWPTGIYLYQCSGAEPLSHGGQPRGKDRSCCARASRVNPNDMFRHQSTSYERIYCWEWSTLPVDDY